MDRSRESKPMWCDELPAEKSWTVLWNGLILCGHCSAIRNIGSVCPVCNDPVPSGSEETVRLTDGREMRVANAVFMGAEGRYEDYIYLKMMEREWKRPILSEDRLSGLPQEPSPQAAIVLLFWTYFETRIERLLRAGLRGIPESLREDLLHRYSFIGARMDKAYKIVFGTTYYKDLVDLGHDVIARHLLEVQQRRNAFSHGNPGAIDDAVVLSVVENLELEHKAWVSVFNRRATRIRD